MKKITCIMYYIKNYVVKKITVSQVVKECKNNALSQLIHLDFFCIYYSVNPLIFSILFRFKGRFLHYI